MSKNSESIETAAATRHSTRASGSALSPFAAKMLSAFQRLTKERVPHPCGGFTTDDVEWQMGTCFTPPETLAEALEELERDRLIRFAGFDDDDAIGTCYEFLEQNDKVRDAG